MARAAIPTRPVFLLLAVFPAFVLRAAARGPAEKEPAKENEQKGEKREKVENLKPS